EDMPNQVRIGTEKELLAWREQIEPSPDPIEMNADRIVLPYTFCRHEFVRQQKVFRRGGDELAQLARSGNCPFDVPLLWQSIIASYTSRSRLDHRNKATLRGSAMTLRQLGANTVLCSGKPAPRTRHCALQHGARHVLGRTPWSFDLDLDIFTPLIRHQLDRR